MEMMFLIVKLGYGSVVMPEKYTVKQCAEIAETINKTYSKEAICVPAPAYNCQTFKALDDGSGITFPTHCNPPTGK